MSSSWPSAVCFSAGCEHCGTKSGSRMALLYIKILTPISRVSTEHELEPDSLSRGLCPALAHQLEFLLQGHTVKISQERQQLCIFKEMGSFFFPSKFTIRLEVLFPNRALSGQTPGQLSGLRCGHAPLVAFQQDSVSAQCPGRVAPPPLHREHRVPTCQHSTTLASSQVFPLSVHQAISVSHVVYTFPCC